MITLPAQTEDELDLGHATLGYCANICEVFSDDPTTPPDESAELAARADHYRQMQLSILVERYGRP